MFVYDVHIQYIRSHVYHFPQLCGERDPLQSNHEEREKEVAAARKGEHDIAIGNVVGSNIFNILAVVGIAGVIEPISAIASEVIYRDWSVMLFTTLLLLVMGYGFGRQGRINRFEGALLLISYLGYNGYLTWSLI